MKELQYVNELAMVMLAKFQNEEKINWQQFNNVLNTIYSNLLLQQHTTGENDSKIQQLQQQVNDLSNKVDSFKTLMSLR